MNANLLGLAKEALGANQQALAEISDVFEENNLERVQELSFPVYAVFALSETEYFIGIMGIFDTVEKAVSLAKALQATSSRQIYINKMCLNKKLNMVATSSIFDYADKIAEQMWMIDE